MLPAHVASDSYLKQRFEREAKTISSLNHPNICTLHDVGREGETDFLVMEYLEGETLAERLSKGALPLDQALKYAIEIADALDKAHRQGVTHRDLKPANIMLTKAGAKLLDFGLAKLTQTGPVSEAATKLADPLTQQGSILGTFQYMAPEQLEGKEADARSDIWAFGCVVYEMVTGERAFPGKTQLSVGTAILENDLRPLSSVRRTTPPALDRVIGKKCLAKDPEARWYSAHDLHDELTWIAEGDSQPGVAVGAQPGQWRLSMPGALAALLVGSVITGVAVWSLTRPEPNPLVRLAIHLPDAARFPPRGTLVDVSPDGRTLAFLACGGGCSGAERRVYRRPLDQLDAVPIPGTEGAYIIFFSPDGQWLGLITQQGLRKVSLAGEGRPSRCTTGDSSLARVGDPMTPSSSRKRLACGGSQQTAASRRRSRLGRWPLGGHTFCPAARRCSTPSGETHWRRQRLPSCRWRQASREP